MDIRFQNASERKITISGKLLCPGFGSDWTICFGDAKRLSNTCNVENVQSIVSSSFDEFIKFAGNLYRSNY